MDVPDKWKNWTPLRPYLLDKILVAVDLAMIRALPGGSTLSTEMTLLLALVAFDGYELFPGPKGHARAEITD